MRAAVGAQLIAGSLGGYVMNAKASLRAMSRTGEFALVTGIAFGLPLLNAFAAVAKGISEVVVTDKNLIGLIVAEITSLGLVAGVLVVRGWNRTDLVIGPSIANTVWGAALVVAAIVSYAATMLTLAHFWGGLDSVSSFHITTAASLPVVGLLALVNPVFEEAVVAGYVVRALRDAGPSVAIPVSALMRVSYHAYQGPFVVVALLPIGLVFAGFFWWRNALWPLFVAHGLMDLAALVVTRAAT